MTILVVAEFGPIVDKSKASQELYVETLGLPPKEQEEIPRRTLNPSTDRYASSWAARLSWDVIVGL